MKFNLLKSFLIFVGCASTALITHGQSTQNVILGKSVDSLVTARLSTIAPGGVVLIAKSGYIIYQKAFGVADIKSLAPMKPEMIFRIGSITKQYTSIAILQLVEQGKISLQDSIQQYVPDFPHKQYPITIENLISQTSGIINYQAIEKPEPAKVRTAYTPAQGVDYFKDESLLFKPGTRFEYSNSNFYLLGYILERVTGQTYEDYLQQHILTPIGLTNTYYIHPEKTIINTVSGYSRFDKKKWENAELEEITTLYSAGGLMANAADLFKWHQALIEGKLVKKTMLNKAFTPFKFADGSESQYAYGWFVKDIDGSKTVEHSGSTDGYQTDEIYLPQEDIFVATLFNGFEQDMDSQVISNDIALLALGKPLKSELILADDSIKQYVGTYTYKDHQIIVTYKEHQLYVEGSNPKDRLPRLHLLASKTDEFYIKEAPLKFQFLKSGKNQFKLITYNAGGKDAEWEKTK